MKPSTWWPVWLGLGLALGVLLRGSEAEVPHVHEGESSTWTCAMHPQIQSPTPGSCPICGMELVPLAAAKADSSRGPEVHLSERALELARLRTEPVVRSSAPERQLSLLGQVEAPEDRRRALTTWVAGRVERLRVASVGERVRRGQVVAEVFSPELQVAERALQVSVVSRAPRATVQAAEQRLLAMGVSEAELEQIRVADQPRARVPIRASASGVVVERRVTQGEEVKAGAVLSTVADLRTVWLSLDAYEADLPWLTVGQTATVEVDALPGRSIEAEIAFVDPVIDRGTRTASVRLEVPNPKLALRPGMFVEARVAATSPRDPLLIPESAPLFAGRKALVYVEQPERQRHYRPREVVLGARLGAWIEVLEGLEEGERVVVEGAFVLDADLQLRGEGGLLSLEEETPTSREPIGTRLADRLLESYLDFTAALAADDLGGARRALGALASRSKGTRLLRLADIASPTLDSLSGARARLLRLAPQMERVAASSKLDFAAAYCPMADGGRGATWLQRGREVANPYFGSEMLGCGEIREGVR